MTGIDRQRCEDREDAVAEPLGDQLSLVGCQIIELEQFNTDFVESRQHLGGEDLFLTCAEFENHRADVFNLFAGSAAVGTHRRDPRGDLVMEPRHPHLEELVEVAGEDRQVANPLKQRNPHVGGKFQDPAVEGQPAQLAVQYGCVVDVPAANLNTHARPSSTSSAAPSAPLLSPVSAARIGTT